MITRVFSCNFTFSYRHALMFNFFCTGPVYWNATVIGLSLSHMRRFLHLRLCEGHLEFDGEKARLIKLHVLGNHCCTFWNLRDRAPDIGLKCMVTNVHMPVRN